MEATVSRLGFVPSPQSVPVPTNPELTIIAILDNATAKDWSYEVLDHEMFEKGVLVVVKVLFKNRTVTAFGGGALPPDVGNLADALQEALLDALTNAARMAGIPDWCSGWPILAPLFEEPLFRGFVHSRLRRYFSINGAAMLSGLVFGVAHFSPGNIIPLAAIGFTLALIYERTGNLLAPMLVHGAWNLGTAIALLVMFSG